jgi:hypothetical protein
MSTTDNISHSDQGMIALIKPGHRVQVVSKGWAGIGMVYEVEPLHPHANTPRYYVSVVKDAWEHPREPEFTLAISDEITILADQSPGPHTLMKVKQLVA